MSVMKTTYVTLDAYSHTDPSACGTLSARPYSRDAIGLTVSTGGSRGGSVTLLNVSLADLEEFVAAAGRQCEAEQWA